MTATFLFHIFSYLFELSVADRFSDYYEHNLAHYEAPKDLYVFSILLLMTINTLFCYESATVQPSNYNTAFLMSNPGPSSYIAMPGLAGAPTGIPPPISVRQPPHSHNHTLSSRAPIARTDAEL
uniref:Uncharacterized protein n=1 Tax=Lotharella oceanica TaxID=641309 RepID=A0A7S2U3G2_9EUKA|mmetsp:Transcript_6268/g.12474  ORF Transcript_6268/g.12474 Transcript_6268/m.12474 type:complete len:124 (+) Transcript_6268:44-415(+)